MAYKIIASQCTVCGACEFECPNAAISLKNDIYVINPSQCTQCEGHSDAPKCAVVLPRARYLRARIGAAADERGSCTKHDEDNIQNSRLCDPSPVFLAR
ncbi:ferredoxin [Bradyrhizobium japonicum]